jgi:hypothetical protein
MNMITGTNCINPDVAQVWNIKNHLHSGKGITPIEALELYGCFRLSAVIFVLRKEHKMNIKMEMQTKKRLSGNRVVTKRWANYYAV